jgi:hypothetical protein
MLEFTLQRASGNKPWQFMLTLMHQERRLQAAAMWK